MPSSAPSECQSCAEADGTLTTHPAIGGAVTPQSNSGPVVAPRPPPLAPPPP